MRVGVFGLGYVGCVTGACLAHMGHSVCGVDIAREKVELINRGHSPVVETGLERLTARAVRRGRLRASLDPSDGVEDSEVSIVCVGTPSKSDGSANLSHVLHAVRDIGRALRPSSKFHTVVVRSTIPPGSMEGKVIPALERSSGKKAGRDFGVCFQPEFLREGSSVEDFLHPPKNVFGCNEPRSVRTLLALWRPIKAPVFLTSLKVAEVLKYVDNAFHALKVCFANEVGALCKSLGVDSHEVMRIFVRDTKLNISPLYLRPGFAFGGPCLPKDLRALCSLGRKARVQTPLLSSLLESNARHLGRALELILATGKKKVGILGLAFKSDTDDLRESPAGELVKRLLRAGKQVKVYDPQVRLERLLGANRALVERELPQLPRLLARSLSEVLATSEAIVLVGNRPEFHAGIQKMKPGQILIDLVRLPAPPPRRQVKYEGICW
jgi:GDP-mannose 6-dehydrogenase